MTTISKYDSILTLINIFGVAPADQKKLMDLLILATQTVQLVPGFISANLHRGLDGTKVTMYAQWESIEAYNRMRENPIASTYLQQALEIATFQPGMYEVVETF